MDRERIGRQAKGRQVEDEALDRALEEALAVEPSPAFLARVRTRVANEPVSWRPWVVAATAALAAIVLAVSLVSRSAPVGTPLLPASPIAAVPMTLPASVERTASSRPEASLPAGREPERVAPRRNRPSPEPERVARVEGPPGPAEPEIVIQPGELAALQALVSAFRDGQIEESALSRLDEPVRELTIEPITIEPLPQLALLEGEQPW